MTLNVLLFKCWNLGRHFLKSSYGLQSKFVFEMLWFLLFFVIFNSLICLFTFSVNQSISHVRGERVHVFMFAPSIRTVLIYVYGFWPIHWIYRIIAFYRFLAFMRFYPLSEQKVNKSAFDLQNWLRSVKALTSQ